MYFLKKMYGYYARNWQNGQIFPIAIASVLIFCSVAARPLPQNGGCRVGFDFRKKHNNTCCKPVSCSANTYFVLCNGTTDNPGHDSCHACPPERPISEPINTAEAAKYSVVDPCMKPDCTCPRPGAVPPKHNPCLKDGKKRCECDRINGYYGTYFLDCQKANDSVMTKVKRPGYELSESGEARRCLSGTFKTTADKSLCKNHSSCVEGFMIEFQGSSTEDVRCKRIPLPTVFSEKKTTEKENGNREQPDGMDFKYVIIITVLVFSVSGLSIFALIFRRRTQNNIAGRSRLEMNFNQLNQRHNYEEPAALQKLISSERLYDKNSKPTAMEHAEDDYDISSKETIDTDMKETEDGFNNRLMPSIERCSHVTSGINNLDNIHNDRRVRNLETPRITSSYRSNSFNSRESHVDEQNLKRKVDVQQKDQQFKITIYGDNNTVIVPGCIGNPMLCAKCKSFRMKTDREQLTTLFDINSVYSFPSTKNLAVPYPHSLVSLARYSHHNVEESGMTSEHFFPMEYIPQQYVPTPVIHEFSSSLGMSSLWSNDAPDNYFPMGSPDSMGVCVMGAEQCSSSITNLKKVYESEREHLRENECSIVSPQIESSLNLASLDSSSEQGHMQIPADIVNQPVRFENYSRECNSMNSRNSVLPDPDDTG